MLYTHSGGDCDSLPQWNPGEPNDAGNNEDCGEMYDSGLINDVSCTNTNSFICEIIITGSTSVEISKPDPIPNNNPIPNSPFKSPSDNIYILEFNSTKDIALIASVLLNIVFIGCIIHSMIKSKQSPGVYAKVDIGDIDDEKL